MLSTSNSLDDPPLTVPPSFPFILTIAEYSEGSPEMDIVTKYCECVTYVEYGYCAET